MKILLSVKVVESKIKCVHLLSDLFVCDFIIHYLYLNLSLLFQQPPERMLMENAEDFLGSFYKTPHYFNELSLWDKPLLDQNVT